MPVKKYKERIEAKLAALKALNIKYRGPSDVPKMYCDVGEPVSLLFEKSGLDVRYMESWYHLLLILACVHGSNASSKSKWAGDSRRRLVEVAMYVRSLNGNSELNYLDLSKKIASKANAPIQDKRFYEIVGDRLYKVLRDTKAPAIYDQLIAEIHDLEEQAKEGGRSLFAVTAKIDLKKLVSRRSNGRQS